ncbi:unnamed protein product [Allacma fusca]|uniref:Adenylate cyclase conserved domain-containing protein n=1 Tax=Allacma fusca TaxID=39272 RepID=A0A8J2KT40_9HEXA|nr:unnamed protein product [Allacma fusca]
MENTSSDYEGTNYSSSRSVTWSMDEMDYLMDHCIEIDSNRRMREQFIKPIQLTFRDQQLEAEFCQLKEDTFKSNVLCVFILWFFVAASLAVVIPRNKISIASLTAASFMITSCLVLVMANEFPSLPKKLIKFSSSFSLRRRDRSLFVIFIITTLALATGLNIVSVS